jgi:protein involved in polysaccharide export with SLBB domain
MNKPALKRIFFLVLCFALFVSTVVIAQPQEQYSTQRGVRDADHEEQSLVDQVTLAPEKIVELLRQEPGLMLEVKKSLVRKAYQQGRLLDPAELTDAVVIQLVLEDNNVRILATQQIQERSYLRARPKAGESPSGQSEIDMKVAAAEQEKQKPGAETTGTEAEYWAAYDKQQQLLRQKQIEKRQQEIEQQQAAPAPAPPHAVPPVDQNQQLLMNRAALDPSSQGPLASGATAQSQQMSSITPGELPGLLRNPATPTSMNYGSTSPLGLDATGSLGVGGGPAVGGLTAADIYGTSPSSSYSGSTYGYGSRRRIASLNQPEEDTTTVVFRRPNPYANVPSLYDIYSQVSKRQPKLERFAAAVFQDDSYNFDDLPMDLPVGPDYVLGPGDAVTIDVWGGISLRLNRPVDREGRLALPEVGTVLVAGKTLGDVQIEVQRLLRTQYRDVQSSVSLSRLRTVRVYVVGDVQHPGAYDISSLSTPLNALYAAGGPTQNGSMRVVKHFRGKQLVQEVDLYDLLLNGTRGDIKTLQPGDTVLIPPVGKQVTVEGMVRRPAIYELNGEKDLAQILELAGGVLTTGTLRHIEVERVEAHENRRMLSLDIPEANDKDKVTKALEAFSVQDGDKVRISPILPYSDKTVYLDGHVFHPGKYPYAKGMKVTDLVKSYADLMPEPYVQHAEIIRLSKPDFRPTVISFDLGNAMAGNGQDLTLEPFDTVRVFGRFDFEDPPEISVVGEVRDPGVHLTNGVTRLSDAVYLAGGLTPEAMLSDVQIIRYQPGGKAKVLSANLALALKGDAANELMLQPRDRVIIHKSFGKLDPPSVRIEGEVARPGKYPLGTDMSAADLVRVAGGFKRSAYRDSADLSRYVIENGHKIVGEHVEVAIGKALAGVEDTNYRLRDGDVLTIRMIGGWKDIGGAISVKGEVVYPGMYGIEEGEHLSSVLKRAGGFRADAYPYGAVFERIQVRELAEKNRQELIRRIEAGGSIKPAGESSAGEQAAIVQAALLQQQQVLGALKSQPASGRMVIHISADISKWEGTVEDVIVRPGDTIVIPKQPYFVMVLGQVYNSNAVTYVPGKEADYYLKQAGGPTGLAKTSDIYVVRADGSLVGKDSFSGWWSGSVKSLKLRPGDSIVVPEKFVTGSSNLKTFLQAAQIMSQIAFTAAVALQ